MRKFFPFYASYLDVITDLPDDQQLLIYRAISRFGILNEDPNLTGILATIFKAIKPNLESSHNQQDFGKMGGRPKNEPQRTPPLNPPLNPPLLRKEEGKEKELNIKEKGLWDSILKFWGFESEMRYAQRHFEINFFLKTLLEKKELEFFKDQFRAYLSIEKINPGYKQSYVRFIQQDGWKDENWIKKLEDVKKQNQNSNYTYDDGSACCQ